MWVLCFVFFLRNDSNLAIQNLLSEKNSLADSSAVWVRPTVAQIKQTS